MIEMTGKIKTHLPIDNNDGRIRAVFFDKIECEEYNSFLSQKYGEMVEGDPEMIRFVWEPIDNYSLVFEAIFKLVEQVISEPYPHR